MILIVSEVNDTHADSVEVYLRKRSTTFFRLNLDTESLRSTKISFDGDSWEINQRGMILNSKIVKAVWPRRLSMYLDLDQENVQQGASFKLWKSEWNRCLFGFYSCVRDVFWLNRADKAALIDNKIYQFALAKRAGFAIPDYLYSNDKKQLIEFARHHGEVAIKFMAQDMYRMADGSYMGAYVNKLSSVDLRDFADSDENPVFLQRYVHKSFEVRHTFVHGRHFSCKIDSQKSQRTATDWRRYDLANTPHVAIVAPLVMQSLVADFMKLAELDYGAFDFIVDQEGQWWYLEVNSAGQWLWIEDLSGLKISESVADCLLQRSA